MLSEFIVARRDELTGKDITSSHLIAKYCRTNHVFDRSLGSSFLLDMSALFPFYILYCLEALGVFGGTKGEEWLGYAYLVSRIPQLYRIVLLKGFFRDMEVSEIFLVNYFFICSHL